MSDLRSRLLELDDEVLVQHILLKAGSLHSVADVCKRLCKLVSVVTVTWYIQCISCNSSDNNTRWQQQEPHNSSFTPCSRAEHPYHIFTCKQVLRLKKHAAPLRSMLLGPSASRCTVYNASCNQCSN